jgi:hypothetical protein
MSRPMNMREFLLLTGVIDAYYSVRVPGGAKYIYPSIDLRTNTVFAIKFAGFGWEATLHCQNECRDLPDSLYERCIKLLKEKTNQNAKKLD